MPATGKWEYAQFVATLRGSTLERRVGILNGRLLGPDEPQLDPFVLLNEMGDEGWELVAIHALMPPSPSAALPFAMYEYVLKRAR